MCLAASELIQKQFFITLIFSEIMFWIKIRFNPEKMFSFLSQLTLILPCITNRFTLKLLKNFKAALFLWLGFYS